MLNGVSVSVTPSVVDASKRERFENAVKRRRINLVRDLQESGVFSLGFVSH